MKTKRVCIFSLSLEIFLFGMMFFFPAKLHSANSVFCFPLQSYMMVTQELIYLFLFHEFFLTFVFKSVNFRFVCCRSFGFVFIIQSCFALILFWIYQCWFELFSLVTCGVKSVWERFRTSRKGIILQWKPQEFDSQSLSNHSLNKHRHQYPLILKLKTFTV